MATPVGSKTWPPLSGSKSWPPRPLRAVPQYTDIEHETLASEWVSGADSSDTHLSFDEYIALARSFSAMAVSMDVPKPELHLVLTQEETDGLIRALEDMKAS